MRSNQLLSYVLLVSRFNQRTFYLSTLVESVLEQSSREVIALRGINHLALPHNPINTNPASLCKPNPFEAPFLPFPILATLSTVQTLPVAFVLRTLPSLPSSAHENPNPMVPDCQTIGRKCIA